MLPKICFVTWRGAYCGKAELVTNFNQLNFLNVSIPRIRVFHMILTFCTFHLRVQSWRSSTTITKKPLTVATRGARTDATDQPGGL
jgi:hypothetical protein